VAYHLVSRVDIHRLIRNAHDYAMNAVLLNARSQKKGGENAELVDRWQPHDLRAKKHKTKLRQSYLSTENTFAAANAGGASVRFSTFPN